MGNTFATSVKGTMWGKEEEEPCSPGYDDWENVRVYNGCEARIATFNILNW